MSQTSTNVLDLIISDWDRIAFEKLLLSEKNKELIIQFLKEQEYIDVLQSFNLPVNNKILLHGSSGCGKTMTAKAIATYLKKPIHIINLSTIVSARVGETGQHLKLVFDKAIKDKAIIFIDEFDQLGKERENEGKDVGEMRRVVNSLIQLIDYLPNSTLLIAATNYLDVIDHALVRRFQLQLSYKLPNNDILDEYYAMLLNAYPEEYRNIIKKYGISFAEAKDLTLTQVKKNIITILEKNKASN